MISDALTPRIRAWTVWSWVLFVAFLFVCVSAQSTTSSISSAPTSAPSSLSFTQTTTFATFTTTIHSGNRNIPIATTIPVVLTLAVSPSPTSSSSSSTSAAPNSTSSATSTPTPQPIVLDTKIDGAFGVLGALLILTGIPNAFLGHKNRWSSFFIIGFYTLSLVCFVLILKYGILRAINPPDATLRGLFVLSCGVAGVAGGGIAIFFWKAAKYFIGAWGGFALALWIQCFRDGGLVGPIGFRWIMYIGNALFPRVPHCANLEPLNSPRCNRFHIVYDSQTALLRPIGFDCIRRRVIFHAGCRLLYNRGLERGLSEEPPECFHASILTLFIF